LANPQAEISQPQSYFFVIRGGSRKKIAKKKRAIKQAKMKT
jgi:hypothetical protein